MKTPLIAITMGDAAGVGPEVIMKSLGHSEVQAMCRPLVIGDAARLEAAGAIVGSTLRVCRVDAEEIEDAAFEVGRRRRGPCPAHRAADRIGVGGVAVPGEVLEVLPGMAARGRDHAAAAQGRFQ